MDSQEMRRMQLVSSWSIAIRSVSGCINRSENGLESVVCDLVVEDDCSGTEQRSWTESVWKRGSDEDDVAVDALFDE